MDIRKSVDPDKKYLLGTHDFLTSGGDGYTILKTLKVKKDFKKCYIRDAVVKYIEKRKVIP